MSEKKDDDITTYAANMTMKIRGRMLTWYLAMFQKRLLWMV